LTGKAIRHHPRPTLRGENPLVGFPIAVERLEIPLVGRIEQLPIRSAVLEPIDRNIVGLEIHIALAWIST